MKIRVSVVVPTYNRPDLLSRCLTALVAQEFDPAAFEIIVVDDAASEKTRGIVNTWADSARLYYSRTNDRDPVDTQDGRNAMPAVKASRQESAGTSDAVIMRQGRAARRSGIDEITIENVPAIQYIALDRKRGPAAARNAGWRAARGDIIAFTDDDCIPSPGWLRAGLSAFSPGVIGASGSIVMPLPAQPTDFQLNSASLTHSEFVTANCFYRRDALKAAGGFDERFTIAWREDTDLYFTLLDQQDAAGPPARFVDAPGAIVVHPLKPAPWGVSLQQQYKSMFNALLYKKHSRLYRERLGPVTPWHYYGIVAALAVSIIAFLTGHLGVSAGAAAFWLGGTGYFSSHRLRHTSHAPRHILEMLLTSVVIPPLAIYWRIRGAIRYRVWCL